MKDCVAVSLGTAAWVLLMAGRLAAAEGLSPRATAIDWPAFMQWQDMTFDKLPQSWKEAPHFGNAMVGSMLYRADDAICLQIFRADVHDHRGDTWG